MLNSPAIKRIVTFTQTGKMSLQAISKDPLILNHAKYPYEFARNHIHYLECFKSSQNRKIHQKT